MAGRRDDPCSVRRWRFARRLGLGRRRRSHWLDELRVATGGARLIFTQRAVVHATGVFGEFVHDAPLWDDDRTCLLGSARLRRSGYEEKGR